MQAVGSAARRMTLTDRGDPAPPARHLPLLGGLRLIGAVAWVLSGHWASPAFAAPPVIQVPTEEELQPGEQATPMTGPLSFLNGISRSGYMLGDMWGLRTALSKYGISFALQETSEVLGNLTGGAKQGAAYDGLTQMLLQLDTKRAFGWYGGTFNVSALQIHGDNLSAEQPADLADRERHRGGSRHAPVGAVVRSEIPRRGPAGHQDRPAKPRPGVHRQPERQLLRQHDVRLAHAAFGRSPRRRPGLSAVGARRAREGASDRSADLPGGRVQWQPGAQQQLQRRRSADAERVRHQLPAERRHAG